MSIITDVYAREVHPRGNPTLEVEVYRISSSGRGMVPSGLLVNTKQRWNFVTVTNLVTVVLGTQKSC